MTPWFHTGGLLIGCWAVLSCAALPAQPTHSWEGNVSANWFEPGNWDAPDIPGVGARVQVDGGTVLLTNATALLGSFSMLGGTLTMSNWATRLQAQTVTLSGGTITLPPAFTETGVSNRVWLAAASNFLLATAAVIDVDGTGYRNLNGAGQGTSYQANLHWRQGSGAGHAGRGGRANATVLSGAPYGSVSEPLAPGSGGGGIEDGGYGFGGGVVRIEAGGTVTIDGTISASGWDATTGGDNLAGSGSGGSILITCKTFGGATAGIIRADGGHSHTLRSGAGSGGRIAVHYTALDNPCATRFSAVGGTNSWADTAERITDHFQYAASWGSVYFTDPHMLETGFSDHRFLADIHVGQTTVWHRSVLQVADTTLRLAAPAMRLTIDNHLDIGEGGVFHFHGTNLTVGGQVTLGTGSETRWFSGAILTESDFGQLFDIGNTLTVGNHATLWLHSDPDTGGSALIRAGEIVVAGDGRVSATARGFGGDKGPGAGSHTPSWRDGAGYGGSSGAVNYPTARGAVYGSIDQPLLPGSGGAGGFMRSVGGGGLIRLETADMILNGALEANGGGMLAGGGAGSGGAIHIRCARLGGDGGRLSVRGGDGSGSSQGGGGGGRMALHYETVLTPHRLTFDAGPGDSWAAGDPDTIGWYRAAGAGTIYLADAVFLASDITDGRFVDGRLLISNQTAWTVSGDLTLRDTRLMFGDPAFELTITGHALVANAILSLASGGTLTVGGDLVLTNDAALRIEADETPMAPDHYGARVQVDGVLSIGLGCWVYPFAHPLYGSSALFHLGGLRVADGGGFKADGLGFAQRRGPGAGTRNVAALNTHHFSGGGGHGGRGGHPDLTVPNLTTPGAGGPTNGLTWMPVHAGSGGDTIYSQEMAGRGGGVIRLDIGGPVTMDGLISANGLDGWDANALSSGGAGGSVFIRCAGRFIGGSNAVLRARGGNAGGNPKQSGGGGGGRIAIWADVASAFYEPIASGANTRCIPFELAPAFEGAVQLEPGSGWQDAGENAAETGTLVLIRLPPPPGTIVMIR